MSVKNLTTTPSMTSGIPYILEFALLLPCSTTSSTKRYGIALRLPPMVISAFIPCALSPITPNSTSHMAQRNGEISFTLLRSACEPGPVMTIRTSIGLGIHTLSSPSPSLISPRNTKVVGYLSRARGGCLTPS
jgi:hypothetical protein